jgi:hypothetical protein
MKRLAFLLAFISAQAAAQYSGPAVDSCLKHASAEILQGPARQGKIVFDRDHELIIERYTRKLGSQFVSSMLLGNGAIVQPLGAPIEMSFVCLLADEKRALFFTWLPRANAPVLAQCRRTQDATACLDHLLNIVERDLTEVYSQHFIAARQADAAAGKGEPRTEAFRRSADTFKAYRDAECARRADPDAARACQIEITRRRALDLR